MKERENMKTVYVVYRRYSDGDVDFYGSFTSIAGLWESFDSESFEDQKELLDSYVVHTMEGKKGTSWRPIGSAYGEDKTQPLSVFLRNAV
jgi:hypothetical protein